MIKKVFRIEKKSIFAASLGDKFSLMRNIDNKPFRRAFGSILEGRFPFYMVECIVFSFKFQRYDRQTNI